MKSPKPTLLCLKQQVFCGFVNEHSKSTLGHGGNFEITISVEVKTSTDLQGLEDGLKQLMQNLCEKIDHKNLSLDIDFFKGKSFQLSLFGDFCYKTLEKLLNAASFTGKPHFLILKGLRINMNPNESWELRLQT